ncbi:hypothetical protein SKAU_G00332600 [Synaphobranchus kaupii]|uniref:Uncharacterized protein n=1 Tax=Synaphobranchus kaupii TaxID=118154 RepID=A0A9Q1ELB2_SYNKA|nr:hypothetical protein SKAU_G00332600 [Synaphobranchus kaupii]
MSGMARMRYAESHNEHAQQQPVLVWKRVRGESGAKQLGRGPRAMKGFGVVLGASGVRPQGGGGKTRRGGLGGGQSGSERAARPLPPSPALCRALGVNGAQISGAAGGHGDSGPGGKGTPASSSSRAAVATAEKAPEPLLGNESNSGAGPSSPFTCGDGVWRTIGCSQNEGRPSSTQAHFDPRSIVKLEEDSIPTAHRKCCNLGMDRIGVGGGRGGRRAPTKRSYVEARESKGIFLL